MYSSAHERVFRAEFSGLLRSTVITKRSEEKQPCFLLLQHASVTDCYGSGEAAEQIEGANVNT